jgi:catalase
MYLRDDAARDQFDAIARGDHPKWTVFVQIMPYEAAKTYRLYPFDLTKVWPHAEYRLIKVGEFELNRNPENYFAQIEQAAFEPSNLVPGIDVSRDRMPMARVFAYADAHRYRIGSNYNEVPVNRSKAAVH